MSSSFRCRAAKASDLDAVAVVWYESARLADAAPRNMPSLVELRERIDAELATGWSLWVATRHRDIVGMLAIRKTDANLDQLFVLPAAQRLGVGRLLLAKAMQQMPDGFTLRTAAANTGARAFYEKAGLTLLRIGTHPGYGAAVCFYGWKGR